MDNLNFEWLTLNANTVKEQFEMYERNKMLVYVVYIDQAVQALEFFWIEIYSFF